MTSNIFTNTNTFSIILNAKLITDIYQIYVVTLVTVLCIWFIEVRFIGLYLINKWPAEMVKIGMFYVLAFTNNS